MPEQDADAAVRRIARLGRSVRRHVARSGLHRDIETGPDLRLRLATGVAVVAVLGALGYAVSRHDTPQPARVAAVAQPSPSNPAVVPIELLPPPPASSPSRSPSPGATRPAAPATTAPRATTAAPRPPVDEKPPPPPSLTANYVITRSFDSGFVTEVTVKNVSGSDQDWQVRVSHAASADVAILRSWSTDVDDAGSTFVFYGPALPPGASQTFGFEATKKTPSAVRPTQCTVNGSACTVTLEG